jgi:hypothetical protein
VRKIGNLEYRLTVSEQSTLSVVESVKALQRLRFCSAWKAGFRLASSVKLLRSGRQPSRWRGGWWGLVHGEATALVV